MTIESITCPQCGAKIEIADTNVYFCQYCGCKLRDSNKITIENVNRYVDEAKLEELRLQEERIKNYKRESIEWSFAKTGLAMLGILVAFTIFAKFMSILGF